MEMGHRQHEAEAEARAGHVALAAAQPGVKPEEALGFSVLYMRECTCNQRLDLIDSLTK